MADLSIGFNTDDMKVMPFADLAFMVERGTRVKREVGIPVGVSWNLGLPMVADRVIREELIDLVFLAGRRFPTRTGLCGPRANSPATTRSRSFRRIGHGGCATSGRMRVASAGP